MDEIIPSSFLKIEKYAPHGTKNRKNGISPSKM